MKMHADEVDIDADVVRRLLAEQFPRWVGLPLERLDSSGTVNALYRLGDDMVIRLPRRVEWGFESVDRDWLTRLASALPVEVPEPLAEGEPAEDYPCAWGVYRWLEGDHPTAGVSSDPLARDLACLVAAVHAIEVSGDPPPGRGATTLLQWDTGTRSALGELEGVIDTRAAAAAWDEALQAAPWAHAARWTHGDLMPANLLVREGRLTGVIDWEGMGLGDPACDLAVAWNTLSATGRATLRDQIAMDDASWARGRGWALCTGLVALPYYVETNPELAANARYRITEVLADPDR
jgi:aminoglycoside phosphotransferase (APT) family kinase protein